MKRKTIISISISISILVVFVIGIFPLNTSAAERISINGLDTFSFSTSETVTIDDSVSRFNREDWFLIEDVDPGLMTLDVSWTNSYDIDCYISTSASKYDALTQGITEYNPESCAYDIQTAGSYYVGIVMETNGRVDDTPYTAVVNFYKGTSSDDATAPEVSITAPADGTIVTDTISITATASDADSGIDYLVCNFGGTNLGADSSSPYSWTFDTTTLSDGSSVITVTAYDVAGNSATDTISVEIDNGIIGPEGEKIAVFFWASDAGTQEVIDEYWTVLQNEGYTKIFNFEDTSDFAADFATVEAYEDTDDTIFFYLFGHGNNNGEDSLTAFAPGTSVIYSSELRVLFDTLDAERIGYLIESCHSGGFPLDFQASPYLAMSTSDEDHNSYAVSTIPGEGLFSDAFFDHVADGYNAVDSFYFARQVVFDSAQNDHFSQFPLIEDYSDYVWFE
ncbi:MAG: Ig-like domain-containing protein [Promethearchaeota archaeon]